MIRHLAYSFQHVSSGMLPVGLIRYVIYGHAGPSGAPPSKRSRSHRDQPPLIDLTADQPPQPLRSCADVRDPPLPRRQRIEALRELFARLDLTREVTDNQVACGGMQHISKDIWRDYKSRAETRHSFDAKVDFWLEMDEALERNFGPECRSHVFGSMLNG